MVTTGPAVAFQRRTRCEAGGRAALMHSQQWAPTGASCRQAEQAGRPQRVHDRPVSWSRWWKHVVVIAQDRTGTVRGGSRQAVACHLGQAGGVMSTPNRRRNSARYSSSSPIAPMATQSSSVSIRRPEMISGPPHEHG